MMIIINVQKTEDGVKKIISNVHAASFIYMPAADSF